MKDRNEGRPEQTDKQSDDHSGYNDNDLSDGNSEQNEEMYFDGERYYTREEWFNPPEPIEHTPKKKIKRGMKLLIASLVTVALLLNVFAMWPQLFNLPAVEFVQVSRELSQDPEIQTLQNAVVVVRAGNSKGTGFVYNKEEGYILTNEHVIDTGDPHPVVTFEDGSAYQTEVIYTDEDLDVAVLQATSLQEHHELSFAEEWSPGDEIVFIGNPLFFNFIANRGILLGDFESSSRIESPLMLDAPVYRGSSGSPVFNQDGKVISVVYATVSTSFEGESQRVGLSIPSSQFIEDIPGTID